MTNHEINEAINSLATISAELENKYIENEGEVTEDTLAMESEMTAIQELLAGDGVDSLGRWLKAKEDELKSFKAESDYIARKMKATNSTIDYIKNQVARILCASGEKAKGSCGYSFSPYTSVKVSVDKETLNDMFMEAIRSRIEGLVPEDVTITLGASVKAVPEGAELPQYYTRTETPAVRFTKPRANKE